MKYTIPNEYSINIDSIFTDFVHAFTQQEIINGRIKATMEVEHAIQQGDDIVSTPSIKWFDNTGLITKMTIREHFDWDNNRIIIIPEFETSKKLTNHEKSAIVSHINGGMSDGWGENYDIYLEFIRDEFSTGVSGWMTTNAKDLVALPS